MLDSIDRGIAELRVRGDGGAKGMKTRRVPITTRLALEMKRYAARLRPRSDDPHLLLNRNGQQYGDLGINELMVRLSARDGYRIHAHAFRHTFATVATQLGWNFERLRSAMGHADYTTLQRYVRLSMERDLGRLEDWLQYVIEPLSEVLALVHGLVSRKPRALARGGHPDRPDVSATGRVIASSPAPVHARRRA